MLIRALSLLGTIVGVAFLALSFASGLFYAAEFIEGTPAFLAQLVNMQCVYSCVLCCVFNGVHS